MILRIADDGGAAAVAAHRLALRHGFHGVVGALAVHVGLAAASSSGVTVGSGKIDDVVDAAQRGDELGAIRGRQDRPAGAFQRAPPTIVVDRDDQAIGLAAAA